MAKNNDPKNCANCGIQFVKPYSASVWARVTTCSRACGGEINRRDRDEAFDEKYIPEPNSGCWLWTGSASRYGYGEIWNGWKTVRASHFSYARKKGPIPDEYCVMHKCDNPHCVNPDHLFLGTQQDNIADMIKKRRHAHAERHRNTRLTTAQVSAIRGSSKKSRELAKEMGVCESHISHIRSGKSRKLG